jgi:hypothetical protein
MHTEHAQVHVGGRIEASSGDEHDSTLLTSTPIASKNQRMRGDERVGMRPSTVQPKQAKPEFVSLLRYLFDSKESLSVGRGTSTLIS